MIFFGTKEKEIKRGKITNVICPNCKENSNFLYVINAKYFHLYWIPFFPYKKTTELGCYSCEENVEKNQISEVIKGKLQRENDLKPAKKPLWMFSGVIIVAILIPLMIFQSSKADSKKAVYIDNPKVGDVYFINSASTNYTTMKIAAIENDNIYFIANDTSVTKFKKTFGINKDHYYTNKTKVFSKSKINALYKDGIIYSIDRK